MVRHFACFAQRKFINIICRLSMVDVEDLDLDYLISWRGIKIRLWLCFGGFKIEY